MRAVVGADSLMGVILREIVRRDLENNLLALEVTWSMSWGALTTDARAMVPEMSKLLLPISDVEMGGEVCSIEG